MERESGILMHISSLPSKYGIGDFGEEAYKFVDFLVESKQKNWQILPLSITSFGDSPYQSFSAFAGNPYFIDLEEFIELGFLSEEDVEDVNLGDYDRKVNYGLLFNNKMPLLKKAYSRAREEIKDELLEFYLLEKDWIRDFSLYMTIKEENDNRSWLEWEDKYRDINSPEVTEFEAENREKIFFWVFTQYYFIRQWEKLKKYSNENGIKIIGDIPIYVSYDSADVWANPEYFNLDDNLVPITVAGTPPDSFSTTGQLWGNPIYNWEVLERDGYSWWIKRMEGSFKLFDTVRIDHFRGFESYWEVDYGSKDASVGRWAKGPGISFFNKMKEELGDLDIIAEDLGFLTDAVRELLIDSGYPGMKVLQFAFDSREDSDYLPHNYSFNSVVYTGTHDNSTVLGWFEEANEDDILFAKKYLKLDKEEGYNWGFIRGAWASPAYLAITSMQDLLGIGSEGRMNIPSTVGGNWDWRILEDEITEDIVDRLREMTEIYKR